MKKQCLVIGLGIWGTSIAKELSEKNMEVLAIDKNIKLVEKASAFVTKALCMDITGLDAFDGFPIDDFDIAVVGVGENIPVSIITCLALKEAGMKYIIAKAGNKMHKRILEKLDVNEIILPEEESGILTAKQILKMSDLED